MLKTRQKLIETKVLSITSHAAACVTAHTHTDTHHDLYAPLTPLANLYLSVSS